MEKKKALYIFLIIVLLMSSPVWIGLGTWLVTLQDRKSILVGGIVLLSIGLIGLVTGIFFSIKLQKLSKMVRNSKRLSDGNILLPEQPEVIEGTSVFPIPQGIKVHQDQEQLEIIYSHKRTGWAWLGIALGSLLLINGIAGFWYGKDLITAIISMVGGPVLIYLCLASLMNHLILRVTPNQLFTCSVPIPLVKKHAIPIEDIKQNHLKEETYYGKMGEVTTYALVVIQNDGRMTNLIRGLPIEVGRYLNTEIERWVNHHRQPTIIENH